ncbi:MAG: Maf family protein [Ignavibacteria bacterium]|nr:Maf family protein [Ignavibacteria bacterium]
MKKLEKRRIILASSSPRRKALLRGLLKNFGLKFVVKPSNIVEYTPNKTVNFSKFVTNLAFEKAASIAESFNGIIIGADTIVVLGGRVLGKPESASDAFRILKLLSNKVHTVYTGLAIIDTENRILYNVCESTKVKFRKLTEKEIKFYIKTGFPMDKAGAYGIQDDLGSTFVERIHGDYFNVVGLPVVKTYLGLKLMGMID